MPITETEPTNVGPTGVPSTPAPAGNSPWDTFRQASRHLGEVLPRMQPTWHAASIAELTPACFERHGLRGAIWDVDGTLMAHHGAGVLPAFAEACRRLLAAPTLRHVILSNSPLTRFTALGRIFPEVPVLRVYRVGDQLVVHRLYRGESSLSDEAIRTLGARGAVALRKPNRALVEFALAELGHTAGETVMIGDQLLTDVAGAQLAGVRTIKVRTAHPESFPRVVRTAQIAERLLQLLRFGTRRSQLGPFCVAVPPERPRADGA